MADEKKTKQSKMGRPFLDIDFDALEKMASIHCTQEEISFILGVSIDTLERAVKRKHGVTYAEFCRQKRAFGKMSLRRAMWQKATQEKDNTLMIWLAKNHLGMTDRIQTDETVTVKEKVYVAEWGNRGESDSEERGE